MQEGQSKVVKINLLEEAKLLKAGQGETHTSKVPGRKRWYERKKKKSSKTRNLA